MTTNAWLWRCVPLRWSQCQSLQLLQMKSVIFKTTPSGTIRPHCCPKGANHPQYGLVSVYHLDFTLKKLKSKNLWTSILCHFLQAQKGFELAKAQADKKRILILTNFSFFSPPLLLYQRWQLMLIQNPTKVKFATRKYVNPLIPESEQDRISPYNINTISTR